MDFFLIHVHSKHTFNTDFKGRSFWKQISGDISQICWSSDIVSFPIKNHFIKFLHQRRYKQKNKFMYLWKLYMFLLIWDAGCLHENFQQSLFLWRHLLALSCFSVPWQDACFPHEIYNSLSDCKHNGND